MKKFKHFLHLGNDLVGAIVALLGVFIMTILADKNCPYIFLPVMLFTQWVIIIIATDLGDDD